MSESFAFHQMKANAGKEEKIQHFYFLEQDGGIDFPLALMVMDLKASADDESCFLLLKKHTLRDV